MGNIDDARIATALLMNSANESRDAIVFLDFDGVLHPGSGSRDDHFMYLPRFENVIRKFDNIRIVISSSWRYFYTLEQLRANFSKDISPRIVGVTPMLEDNTPGTRYKEIELYLSRLPEPPDSWIAIDDANLGFPEGCRNLILCSPFRNKDGRQFIA